MHRRGLRGIHGPVLHGLVDLDLGSSSPVTPIDTESRAVLRTLLATGTAPALPGRPLLGDSAAVRGPVSGGNLTVLASLAGTPWALDATDSIVVLEDVHEPPYRIERALCQLLDSGGLRAARGVALGDFYQCRPDAPDVALADIFRALLAVRAHRLLERELGRAIPLVDLFAHPTIRALARRLGGEDPPPIAPNPGVRADALRRQRLRRRGEA